MLRQPTVNTHPPENLPFTDLFLRFGIADNGAANSTENWEAAIQAHWSKKNPIEKEEAKP